MDPSFKKKKKRYMRKGRKEKAEAHSGRVGVWKEREGVEQEGNLIPKNIRGSEEDLLLQQRLCNPDFIPGSGVLTRKELSFQLKCRPPGCFFDSGFQGYTHLYLHLLQLQSFFSVQCVVKLLGHSFYCLSSPKI